MPPSDPAAVCPCGSPNIDWTANGKLLCARCATNAVVASASFVTPAAVPPPDSHEPAGRVDVSGSAPEWAVEMAFAHTFPADYKAYGYAKARDVWKHLEGTSDWRRMHTLARLLASVREGALREAAEACSEKRIVVTFGQPLPEYEPIPFNTACSECEDSILSLLHTPPSGGAG